MGTKGGRPLNPEGRKVTGKGHVIVRLEDGSWVPEHRKVVEDAIGRSLRTTEKVKHVDDDQTNNVIGNLEVWELVRTIRFDEANGTVRQQYPSVGP